MEKKEWNKFDLENYIKDFSEVERDNVLKQVVEADLLNRVLDTTEGKLILNNVVDIITNSTMKIVSLCVGDEKEKLVTINEAAHHINIAYSMMYKWAIMLTTGKAHEEKIKKAKNKS